MPGVSSSRVPSRANGVAMGMDHDLQALHLLHDRYLLLRRGKRSYHLVEILDQRG